MGERKSGSLKGVFIHKTAVVSNSAKIGAGTKIWAFAQIGKNAKIGRNCVIANGAFIDRNVVIGDNVKVHNKALLYNGLIVEDDCFIGPAACFTNDKFPKHDKTRDLKRVCWRMKKGASIGAGAIILPDLDIGRGALVGAGSVVTSSVPDKAIVCGNPARRIKS